jgi:hypothetical protein
MKTKICTKCGVEKTLSEFSKHKDRKYGVRNWCKLCSSEDYKQYRIKNKDKIQKYMQEFYQQYKSQIRKKQKEYRIKYPWKFVLYNIWQRCENPKSTSYPTYGAREIKILISEKEIKELWFRDKAYEMKKPSIDRIDNNGNYTFENCRFIEQSLNSSKDKFKPVLQFDLKGNFIKEWSSQKDASHQLKVAQGNISSVLNNSRFSAGGFSWKFKEI